MKVSLLDIAQSQYLWIYKNHVYCCYAEPGLNPNSLGNRVAKIRKIDGDDVRLRVTKYARRLISAVLRHESTAREMFA
jgi:hypothetical protein